MINSAICYTITRLVYLYYVVIFFDVTVTACESGDSFYFLLLAYNGKAINDLVYGNEFDSHKEDDALS